MTWRVALLAEGVDRNIGGLVNWPSEKVALLAEGVDRNAYVHNIKVLTEVALLAEGVDRNFASIFSTPGASASPSSRRAWIEIRMKSLQGCLGSVALLAEGVDRN